jgi:predicted transcriptional regulator
LKYYDDKIDKAIIKALYQNNTLSANELRRQVDKSYKRVWPSVFSFHRETLLEQALIDKNDTGRRGGRVYYFLTEKAKDEYRADILELRLSKEDNVSKRRRSQNSIEESEALKHQKMFLLLFFFGTVDRPVYQLRTEDELKQFLSNFRLSKNDIKVIEEGNGRREDLTAIFTTPRLMYRMQIIIDNQLAVWPVSSITPPYRLYITQYEPILGRIKIWKERYAYFDYDDHTSIRRELNKIRHSIKNDFNGGSNIQVYLYRYNLPGISAADLLNHERFVFEHIDLTGEEVKRALTVLLEKGMICKVFEFDREPRFSIAEPALEEVITNCWEILQTVREIAFTTWMYFRGPTEPERKWLAVFYGNEKSEELFRSYYDYRKRWKPKVEEDKDFSKSLQSGIKKLNVEVRHNIDSLYKKCDNDIIKAYGFPLDKLIRLVYPETLRQAHNKGGI